MVSITQDLASDDAIERESWNYCSLSDALNSNNGTMGVLKWMAKHGLIKNVATCSCGHSMNLIKRKDVKDGFQWFCGVCKKRKSVRTDSFFYNCNFDLKKALLFIYGWTKDYLESSLNTSTHSGVDWSNYCRQVCSNWVTSNEICIGGFNEDFSQKIVEIDETKFFHRKYHRGTYREGHWVFGGIERGSKKCFMVEVPDRREETLFREIVKYTLPGTIIVSDGWSAYSNIERINNGWYDHWVVIHERNFVSPDNPIIHTQNIENMWMRVKRKLRRQFGTSSALFSSYLDEFMWRNAFFNVDLFSKFIIAIKNFPLP